MKCLLWICLVGLIAFASGQSGAQCNWNQGQENNLAVDESPGHTRLGGRWMPNDFPANTSTQDFSVLAGRSRNWLQNTYIYIPNTVPDGLNMYNQHWLPQTLIQKLNQDPAVRPEGYKYALITPYNKEYPCVEIVGANGFGIEIMVYALVDVEICIRHKYEAASLNSQSAQLFNNICGQQRLRHCFIGPDYYNNTLRPTTGNFVFDIYVQQASPPDFTVPVFYRVRRSEFQYASQGSQLSSGNTEMWCMMISGSVDASYPEFASVVPPNIQIPATGSAHGAHAFSTFIKIFGGTIFALVAVMGW